MKAAKFGRRRALIRWYEDKIVSEDRYILEQFYMNFIEGRSENIVIYGTGVHTEKLLENLQNRDRIAGLMDAARTGQTVYGLRVLSYEEIEKLQNPCIVIVARNSVINVIYRRIQEFVEKNHIPVYCVNGKELKATVIAGAEQECFSLKKEDLLKRIDEAETVSFDVFDTLLCRCVVRPIDVFVLMDDGLTDCGFVFSKERMRAEKEVDIDNYNIYDIYNRLQVNTGISDLERDELLALEIATEEKVLLPRESVCAILKYALEKGKDVYLISDMYIPAEMLRKILSFHGITGCKELIVSTDYKSAKTERLFEKVRDKFAVDTSKWLHIGDNAFSDIHCPGRLGIGTYQLYGTVEMLEQSIYSRLLEYKNSAEENVVIAAFAAIAFNDPFSGFSNTGKINVSDEKCLAQLIVAPILMKYVIWLSNNIKENDLILFPSRDGYILKKIYEFLQEKKHVNLPKCIYLYVSRRALLVAAAENERDIRHIIKLPSPDSTANRITKRFEVKNVQIDTADEQGLSDDLLKRLLEAAGRERSRYLEYLGKEQILNAENPLLVDFVAVGTMQEALQRMTGKSFSGAYFCRRKADSKFTKDLQCKSMYDMAGDFETDSNIYKYYYFLETVVSSYEPTFKRISESNRMDFFEENRSSGAIEKLKIMHGAILKYCELLFDIFPNVEILGADVKLYDEILGFFGQDYLDIDKRILEDVVNYDEFLGKKVTELNR